MNLLSRSLFTLSLLCLGLACSEKKKMGAAATSANAVVDPVGKAGVNYPKLFCENAPKIKVRSDISEELALLCNNKQPTQEFIDLRAEALSSTPGQIDVRFLRKIQTEADDGADFMLGWVFHVPVRPFIVKGRPLYDYIAQGHQGEKVKFNVTTEKLPDSTLEPGGLHLWSVEMNYSLAVQALPTLALANVRKTQYNLWQVLSGNEELGIAIEHLTESPGDIYKASSLVSISFNDGDGFNDGRGGTVVINYLKFKFTNQGFPQTAEQTMMEIAKALANHMYNGLKE